MRIRVALALPAVLALAGPLAAAEPSASIDKVAVAPRRRGLELRAVGKAAGIESLEARVRRGEAVALATVCVVADGAFRVEVLVERRLLPDEYVLEVGAPGGPALAKQTFRVGAEGDVAPAAERMLAWLKGARGALRDLAAILEKRGRYHLAQLEALRADKQRDEAARARGVIDQAKAWAAFLDQLDTRYRTARMDFAAYERELALPPYPDAGAKLASLFPLIQRRRELFVRAIDEAARGGTPRVEEPTQLLDVAHALSAALGEKEPELERWQAGPLAAPEKGWPENGVFVSPVGFEVEVPAGYVPQLSVLDPDLRVRFLKEGDRDLLLMVRVVDGIDATDDAAFERFSEMSAWEGFSSYRRLEGARLDDGRNGYKRIVTATQQGRSYKILQTDLFAGRRIFAFLCIAPPERFDSVKEEFEKAAATFKLRAVK